MDTRRITALMLSLLLIAESSCLTDLLPSFAITYDPLTQVMRGNWKFETLGEDGSVIAERIRPLAMRQTYKQELRYLAELCGFEVLHIYGDYHRSERDTGRYVWILRKM